MQRPFHTDLPAHPSTPSRVRERLREWLRHGDCDEDTSGDVVLAASEAVSNACEHAYPPDHDGVITVGAIAVDSELGGTRAVVTVTDTGRWRRAPSDPGFRGRGLAMMEALVQRLHIEHRPTGTQVRMTSQPCRHDQTGTGSA